MSPLLSTLAAWLLLGVVMSSATILYERLDQAATSYVREREEEHAVRACGRAVAAARNLEAARRRLTGLRPDLASRFATAAADLLDDLAPPSPLLPPPDASGRCASPGPRRLAASPHLERHAGQPEPWPNWTMRFVEGGTP